MYRGKFSNWHDLFGSKYNERIVESIPGYREDTVTQISRLYGALVCGPDDMVMLGDCDMMALSDAWHPDPKKITIYNHDLTNYQDIPICYAAMTRERWIEVMGLNSDDYNSLIKRDLDTLPQAKSTDFYTYWGSDQNLLTQRINAVNFPKDFIDRGKLPSGYAIGRIDRGDWKLSYDTPLIDCHQHRELYKIYKKTDRDEIVKKKWADHVAMLTMVWPDESFNWYFDFLKKFASMV